MARRVAPALAVAAVAGLVALPATAQATEFQGLTEQGKPIGLTVDNTGMVQIVLVR